MTRLIPGRDRPPRDSPPPRALVGALATALAPSDSPSPATGAPGDPHDGSPADTAAELPDDPAGALWAAYRRTPGRLARDRLVLHYRPLVWAVVRRTAERLPTHVDHADLVQSGIFGLLGAIERYDPTRCPRFEGYAVTRIRGAVLDELRAQDWVPRTVRLRARDAERAREDLTARLRRPATEREVADALHLGRRELSAAATVQVLSVEQMCEGADGGVVDALADAGPDPATAAQEHEMRRQLWLAVAQLDERDRSVVRLYYLERRTLAEIGGLLGVTESRICQLHSRLVGRLRGALEDFAAA